MTFSQPNNVIVGDYDFLFTSESVGEGHPDKICDQVSDAILDACLRQDPESKVACETVAKTGLIFVCGEITTKAVLDYQSIVRNTVQRIGYVEGSLGLDYKSCNIMVSVEQQSPDIAQGNTVIVYTNTGVHEHKKAEEMGAGDQGLMFGYACEETPELMPLTCVLAHQLNRRLADLRRSTVPWLGPDSKTQVTVAYRKIERKIVPLRVHTIVISAQHTDSTPQKLIEATLRSVCEDVIPSQYLDSRTIFHLNPSKKFVIGGPQGDAGLTGRKIIVDTYGGWGGHGGGAFSGKDPSKVDRSAAYGARWVAKSIVSAGLASRACVQLSYAIGVAEPLSISVDTYGTGVKSDKEIVDIIRNNFKLTPYHLITDLGLKNPIYEPTAVYGHFGRQDFSWEQPKPLKF